LIQAESLTERTAAELTGWLDQAAQIVTQLQTATTAPAIQT
jgi:hypothetical protein